MMKTTLVLVNEVMTKADVANIMVSATDNIKDYECFKVFGKYFKMLIENKDQIEVELSEHDYDALREYDIIDYDEDDETVMNFNVWWWG